ncbi:polymeric immunoglobulin receptor-like isoform X1 [Pygocentrus nattereri]|uniref:Ig-like domain-containing protein n=1 Tax=Pygocentrus nattereri TaxID=42514 RepID=A0AAR2L3S6_PYGNA|nr:polymeric immunoglobulin receptor-like isoform X1 [Pygocentrus nattereri]
MKILHLFTFFLASGLVDCVDVVGYAGRSVIINCRYSTSLEAQAKVVCRRVTICETKIRTSIINQWLRKDRFYLYDDTEASVIRVFIGNLSLEDAGPYRCAVVQESVYRSIGDWELKVEEDSCCGGSMTVTAQLGQSVSFSFGYSEKTTLNAQRVFKMHKHSVDRMISTTGTPVRLDEDMRRFSISDNSETKVVRVSIKNVTVDDAGLYFCGVQISGSPVSSTSAIKDVHLIVHPTVTGSKMTSYEGDTVEVRCPYSSKYKPSSKHICKEGECFTERRNLRSQATQRTPNKTERFSVHDDITAGVFSVNISRVKAEDAGRYWCGVEKGDVLMNYLSTELQVVRKEVLQVFGRETLSVSIECSYRGESPESDGKFLCMGQQLASCDKGGVKVSSEKNRTGRFSLSDDAPAGVFTVTITDLREEDSGTYWCGEESFGSSIYTEVHLQVMKGSSVISMTVCLCLALLLIGGLFLILYKLRCNKTQQGSTLSLSGINLKDNKEVPPVVCNSEETHLTALITQSTVTDPTYATVSFLKSPASLCDTAVTFSTEESTSEYATVRRHEVQK